MLLMGKLTISMENHHAIQFGKSTNQWFRISQDPISPRPTLVTAGLYLCASSRWGPGAIARFPEQNPTKGKFTDSLHRNSPGLRSLNPTHYASTPGVFDE